MRYALMTAAACTMLLCACSETSKENNVTGDADTMVLQTDENLSGDKKEYTNWRRVDFAAPVVEYDEIRSHEITVRRQVENGATDTDTSTSTIFSIDENILFDFDGAEIREDGKQKLDEIAASIKQRYPNGAIGIYGYTDHRGTEAYNETLSQQRADAVKQYLQQNTGIDMSRINTYGEGEADNRADTDKGMQQNRKVDIVAQDADN